MITTLLVMRRTPVFRCTMPTMTKNQVFPFVFQSSGRGGVEWALLRLTRNGWRACWLPPDFMFSFRTEIGIRRTGMEKEKFMPPNHVQQRTWRAATVEFI